jgi:NAD(P)-dependent dehydrogenase (short-subunit alcohol dehydrogenase family)
MSIYSAEDDKTTKSTPRNFSRINSRSQSQNAQQRTRDLTRQNKMPTYFLTGANRGIGLEFVRQLASKPNTTIIAGVRSKHNDISSLQALNTSKNIHIIECDVSSSDSLSSLEFRVAEILSRTGSNLDAIFNIAGINATSSDTSLTLTSDSLANHMQTNVFGPAKIVQSLARYLARGATVLNMTSGLGSLTVATDVTKCCTYSMSKAALNMLTLHQAKDLKAAGVKVVCMDPGWVKTRMGGKGAMIEAEVSVGSILDVVRGLREADSGKYFRYDGSIVPW